MEGHAVCVLVIVIAIASLAATAVTTAAAETTQQEIDQQLAVFAGMTQSASTDATTPRLDTGITCNSASLQSCESVWGDPWVRFVLSRVYHYPALFQDMHLPYSLLVSATQALGVDNRRGGRTSPSEDLYALGVWNTTSALRFLRLHLTFNGAADRARHPALQLTPRVLTFAGADRDVAAAPLAEQLWNASTPVRDLEFTRVHSLADAHANARAHERGARGALWQHGDAVHSDLERALHTLRQQDYAHQRQQEWAVGTEPGAGTGALPDPAALVAWKRGVAPDADDKAELRRLLQSTATTGCSEEVWRVDAVRMLGLMQEAEANGDVELPPQIDPFRVDGARIAAPAQVWQMILARFEQELLHALSPSGEALDRPVRVLWYPLSIDAARPSVTLRVIQCRTALALPVHPIARTPTRTALGAFPSPFALQHIGVVTALDRGAYLMADSLTPGVAGFAALSHLSAANQASTAAKMYDALDSGMLAPGFWGTASACADTVAGNRRCGGSTVPVAVRCWQPHIPLVTSFTLHPSTRVYDRKTHEYTRMPPFYYLPASSVQAAAWCMLHMQIGAAVQEWSSSRCTSENDIAECTCANPRAGGWLCERMEPQLDAPTHGVVDAREGTLRCALGRGGPGCALTCGRPQQAVQGVVADSYPAEPCTVPSLHAPSTLFGAQRPCVYANDESRPGGRRELCAAHGVCFGDADEALHPTECECDPNTRWPHCDACEPGFWGFAASARTAAGCTGSCWTQPDNSSQDLAEVQWTSRYVRGVWDPEASTHQYSLQHACSNASATAGFTAQNWTRLALRCKLLIITTPEAWLEAAAACAPTSDPNDPRTLESIGCDFRSTMRVALTVRQANEDLFGLTPEAVWPQCAHWTPQAGAGAGAGADADAMDRLGASDCAQAALERWKEQAYVHRRVLDTLQPTGLTSIEAEQIPMQLSPAVLNETRRLMELAAEPSIRAALRAGNDQEAAALLQAVQQAELSLHARSAAPRPLHAAHVLAPTFSLLHAAEQAIASCPALCRPDVLEQACLDCPLRSAGILPSVLFPQACNSRHTLVSPAPRWVLHDLPHNGSVGWRGCLADNASALASALVSAALPVRVGGAVQILYQNASALHIASVCTPSSEALWECVPAVSLAQWAAALGWSWSEWLQCPTEPVEIRVATLDIAINLTLDAFASAAPTQHPCDPEVFHAHDPLQLRHNPAFVAPPHQPELLSVEAPRPGVFARRSLYMQPTSYAEGGTVAGLLCGGRDRSLECNDATGCICRPGSHLNPARNCMACLPMHTWRTTGARRTACEPLEECFAFGDGVAPQAVRECSGHGRCWAIAWDTEAQERRQGHYGPAGDAAWSSILQDDLTGRYQNVSYRCACHAGWTNSGCSDPLEREVPFLSGSRVQHRCNPEGIVIARNARAAIARAQVLHPANWFSGWEWFLQWDPALVCPGQLSSYFWGPAALQVILHPDALCAALGGRTLTMADWKGATAHERRIYTRLISSLRAQDEAVYASSMWRGPYNILVEDEIRSLTADGELVHPVFTDQPTKPSHSTLCSPLCVLDACGVPGNATGAPAFFA